MADDSSFDVLMARLRAGDDEAAARVFRRFARRLIALAQVHLSGALRQKEDPEDVVQSAFKSFFRRQADRPYEVDSWDNLWNLLALITVRKCCHRADAFGAACRDVNREAMAADDPAAAREIFARDPTPSEAAMLAETLERVLRGLDERDRRIVVLSLQGYAVLEISAELGCTERTVYRVLARVKRRLEDLRDEAPDAP
jgi:RNA polymerase sigma-70 factor (ECF subfamily)